MATQSQTKLQGRIYRAYCIEPGNRSGLFYSCRDPQHNTLLGWLHNFELAELVAHFLLLYSHSRPQHCQFSSVVLTAIMKRLYLVISDSAQWLAGWCVATARPARPLSAMSPNVVKSACSPAIRRTLQTWQRPP